MKNYKLIMLLTFTTFQTSICQGLFFESKIYVTDTRGHIDSISVGFNPNLTSQYNPELGEMIVMSPFDSVLDVRGVILKNGFISDSAFNTKKLVSNCHTQAYYNNKLCYRTVQRMFLAIHAKYPPVTISWDRDTWAEECTAGSWITTWWLSETVTGWYNSQDTSTYKCMGLNSSVTWTLPYTKPQPDEWKWANWYRVHEIEGGTLDTIPFIQIAPKYRYFFDTPCWVSPVGTDDVADSNIMGVYPNPAFDKINIVSAIKPDYILIHNIIGSIEKRLDYSSTIDISELSPGVKVITLYFGNGSMVSQKFIKL